MLFNSFGYAVFFTIVFIIYWLVPQKVRWALLLGASLYFYLAFRPVYIVILIFMTLISYGSALLIEKSDNRKYRKALLTGCICISVGVLFVYKYLDFTIVSLQKLMSVFSIGMSGHTISLIMPIGISFYTFQTLGYVIDVYRDKIPAEKHIGYYALFATFFPQIASGPIGRADKLLPQYKNPVIFDTDKAMTGIVMIIWGFYKKLVVADTLSVYVNNVFADVSEHTGGTLMLAAVFYSFQIYCDFSGYSDIAIGSAKLLGIDLMENFRSPYMATSIKEFWSRWHISLSTWFRDYVYIPLGGNRCSKLRRDINLCVTFLVSGIWHGANWTFVLWGLLHGIMQTVENHIPWLNRKADSDNAAQKGVVTKTVNALRIMIVFALVTLAWIFFRADSITDAVYVIGHMFSGILSPVSYVKSAIGGVGIPGNIRLLYVLIIIFILIVTDIFNRDGKLTQVIVGLPKPARIIVCMLFMMVTVLFAQKGVAAEFVYLQF